MELIYIWIGEPLYSNRPAKFCFQNQGFCLNSKYEVDFEPLKRNRLTFIERKDYDEYFYNNDGNKTIKSLTCIVGKNGAGKTSVIELITDVCRRSFSNLFEYQLLVIWKTQNTENEQNDLRNTSNKEDQQENIYKYCICQKTNDYSEIEIKTSINLKDTIFCSSKSAQLKESNISELKNDLNQLTVINYSSLFDDSKIYVLPSLEFYNKEKRIIDITTLGLINRYNIEFKENKQNEYPNSITCYKAMELKKKVLYYSYILQKKHPLKKYSVNDKRYFDSNIIRKEICIVPYIMQYDQMHKTKYEEAFKRIKIGNNSNLFIFIDNITESLKNTMKDGLPQKEAILWQIAYSYWFILLDTLITYRALLKSNLTTQLNPVVFNVYQNPIYNLKKAKDNIKKLFEESNNGKHIEFIDNSFNKFIKFYNSLLKNSEIDLDFKLSFRIDQNPDTILKLIDNYYGSQNKMSFGEYASFYFEPRMSSGEQNMLTLLSRLNYLATEYSKDKIADNILLTIDEGETTFHPLWQKKYVFTLIDYLTELFKDKKKNIRLILTTNNPIMLSDILKEDIIYIEDKKVVKKEQNTFGAEINSLYADSFFIDDGLMGNFAQSKLQPIIDYINDNNKKATEEEIDKYRKIINHIGDLNVKNYLTTMLERKLWLSNAEVKRND